MIDALNRDPSYLHEQNILRLIQKFKDRHHENKIRKVYEEIKCDLEKNAKIKEHIHIIIFKNANDVLSIKP
ncbi:MAG: hypothetical protein COU46_02615 [Candidatus Niyogibacteria bacterium CG10_big_fil_rev_8_21_14_0_10_42_19]|uniref:Uncharacterized protein n=1 Tax=Candidatus Niyogibacteria bacterium CG10_big_fil_rev_8_21_14_0_10_42_19 TaxID=1974725 RepID=A0A2H0TF95_9BACT|nr:MAG: hypothetical protein COU46_02615 [Candidatus Niyogibacteria bacterium CG10_big_fil_rev_8_21_14_0_10_42_19]